MQRRQSGWTLVELMLIVGLLGVLMAIAYPFLQSHRERVRVAQAVQEIAMIGAMIERHALDARAFPATLADVGQAGLRDPWGRPYVYYNVDANGRGHARKDRALNPINTDFDLYSLGRDGNTHKQVSQRASADDVLRANNGRFIGLAAKF